MSETFNLNNASQYNQRVNATMLSMARYVPVIAVVYCLMVHFKVIAGSDLYLWQASVLLLAALFITGLTQSKQPGQSALQQFNFYMIFLSFSVFVIGLQSVLIYWAPLSVTTALNFGMRGYWWSCVLLFGFALLDSYIQFPLKGMDYVWNNLALAGLTTVAGAIITIIIVALMTDQGTLIKLKQKENLQFSRMQAIINSISDAIFSIDKNGVIKTYNAAALSLLDTNKSLIGQKLDNILELRDIKNKKIKLYEVMLEQNKTISREDLSLRLKDGETVRLSITGAPIYSSFHKSRREQEGFIFIMRDITKTKSLEEERDEFISVISHELRTPIAITEASISNMQIMAKREEADVKIMNGLGETHDQIIYLAKMINDLSSLSRAERKFVDLNDIVNVNELMENLYKKYIPEARSYQLHLNLDIVAKLGTIKTNRLYLEEVLQNLITNALKYTHTGSVVLHASVVENGILFAVKDTGVGIAKSERKKIFQKFYRSEDYRTRETKGTGLGLYVAQKLANRLNSVITLDSRLHHGSTFSFVIGKNNDS